MTGPMEDELQRAILAGLPDVAVLAFDRDLRFTRVEGAALARIGWTPEELLGHRPSEVLPPARAAVLEGHYRRALAGDVARFELTSARRARDFVVEVTPVHGPSGEVRGGVAVARDVTERLRAERERGEAEQRLRLAFEEAPIGMAMTAMDGRFVRVNGALSRALRRPAAELLERRIHDVTHPDDLPQLELTLDGERDSHAVEQRCVTADGTGLVAELTVTLVRDGEGFPLYFLLQLVDVTERRRAEQRLQERADRDGLTGLLNARRFHEELEGQIARTRRYGNPATLLLLDLNRFKLVNDRFGHAAGDALLRDVAGALRRRLRKTDHVARLGGDEFAVLLPETPADAAQVVLRDLVTTVAEHGLVGAGADAVQVTTSIGLVAIDATADTAGEVLQRADAAMYADKRDGAAPARVP